MNTTIPTTPEAPKVPTGSCQILDSDYCRCYNPAKSVNTNGKFACGIHCDAAKMKRAHQQEVKRQEARVDWARRELNSRTARLSVCIGAALAAEEARRQCRAEADALAVIISNFHSAATEAHGAQWAVLGTMHSRLCAGTEQAKTEAAEHRTEARAQTEAVNRAKAHLEKQIARLEEGVQ